MWEITIGESASIRQPHWHRHLDVKRPLLPCADAQAISISVSGLPTSGQIGVSWHPLGSMLQIERSYTYFRDEGKERFTSSLCFSQDSKVHEASLRLLCWTKGGRLQPLTRN